MKLLVSTVAPYTWVRLDKHGKPMDKGQFIEAAFLNTFPKKVKSVIAVAPADASTFHRVEIPTKNRSNMLAALPYALEDKLSEDLDQLHFTVIGWVPGGAVDVVVIAREKLATWIQLFADAGVVLDAVIAEHSLLPIHPDCDATIVKQNEDRLVVKTAASRSFTLDRETFDDWWSDEAHRALKIAVNDQPLAIELKESGGDFVSHWAIGDDFRSWLEQAPQLLKSAPSLLQGEFEPAHLKPNSRLLNAGALITFLTLLAMAGSNYWQAERLQAQVDANQQQTRSLFEAAFPDQEYLDRPRRQIASLLSISEDQPASELFAYLTGIAADVLLKNNAELEELNYRNEQMQIGLSAPNFAALDNITAQLNMRDDIRAALISSGTRDQGVSGQIKLARVGN